MATATAGVEWTAVTKTMITIATASVLADGGETRSARCAWGSALAPFDIQLQLRGLGDSSATGNVNIYYKWANLTASGSSTALISAADGLIGWNLAMVVEMNSTSIVTQSVSIPVEGMHLATAMENSTSGCVSAISLVSIARHVKAG